MNRFNGYWSLIQKQPKHIPQLSPSIHYPWSDFSLPVESTHQTPVRPFSTLLHSLKIPQLPQTPDTCCQSGCKHCVWDLYTDEFNASISALELVLAKKDLEKALKMEIIAFIEYVIALG
jgi:hypothetical protein